ncbi:hypothetical protein pipiens_000261, partial [Culex pipiens pipiens]
MADVECVGDSSVG